MHQILSEPQRGLIRINEIKINWNNLDTSIKHEGFTILIQTSSTECHKTWSNKKLLSPNSSSQKRKWGYQQISLYSRAESSHWKKTNRYLIEKIHGFYNELIYVIFICMRPARKATLFPRLRVTKKWLPWRTVLWPTATLRMRNQKQKSTVLQAKVAHKSDPFWKYSKVFENANV